MADGAAKLATGWWVGSGGRKKKQEKIFHEVSRSPHPSSIAHSQVNKIRHLPSFDNLQKTLHLSLRSAASGCSFMAVIRDWYGGEMPVSVNLKIAILQLGLRQYDLAARLGISETRFSRILQGRIDPTPEERGQIATALGGDENQLFDDHR
jgi:hypothetical protein